MNFMSCSAFEPLQEGFINKIGSKLVHKLLVIDWLDLAIFSNLTRDAPGIDVLLLRGWNVRVLWGLLHVL